MSEAVAGKGLKLNCSIEPNLPCVRVDRQRIRHVFTNFITNALKHSPPGGEILLRASNDGELSVQFSVIDQGPGFRKNSRAESSTAFIGCRANGKPAPDLVCRLPGKLWLRTADVLGSKAGPDAVANSICIGRGRD